MSFRSEPCLNQTRNQIKNHGTSSAIPFETTKSLVLSKKRLKTSFLQSTYQLLNQARTKAETKSKAIEPVLQDHWELCEKDQSQNQTLRQIKCHRRGSARSLETFFQQSNQLYHHNYQCCHLFFLWYTYNNVYYLITQYSLLLLPLLPEYLLYY